MAHKRTAIVCGKLCTAPEGDYFETCSFDSNHIVLRSRMPYHIIKCLKQHPGHNKIQCPYDSTEFIDPDKFPLHLLTCESKRSIFFGKYETAELKASGNACNIKQTPFFHASAPKQDEEWGGTPIPDELQEARPSVGRGSSRPQKNRGLGRGEFIKRILKRYEEELACNTLNSNRLSDGNVDRRNIPGQFDDA